MDEEDRVIEANRRASALATLLCLSLALACGGSGTSQPRDLTVVSHTPGDERPDASEPFQIRFDKPVVGEEQIGQTLAQAPVSIEPAIEFKAQWTDRQTLVVSPAVELAPSTRYAVRLTGPLAGRTGGFQFAFVNRPLEVDGVWGMSTERIAPKQRMPIHFNQPVRAADVARHCRLVSERRRRRPAS